MKIIEAIKKALKEKGIDEKYAERIQKTFKVEKEEDIPGSVDSFKENILPAITEAEEAAKKATKEELEKQAKAEKEKAEKEAKEKAEKEKSEKEAKEKEKGEEKKDVPGIDPAIQALIEAQNKQLEQMKDLLAVSQKKAENSEKVAAVRSLLKEAKLPEEWIDRVKLDSDVKFEDQVKALEGEYTKIKQDAINEKVAAGEYTPGSFQIPDRSEADWLKIMNGDASGTAPGVAPLE